MRDKPLTTYLIVNICLDLGKPAVVNKKIRFTTKCVDLSGASLAMRGLRMRY